MQPRDPSSVDADAIDLRGRAPDGPSTGGDAEDGAEELEELDELDDSPDPDNPFLLGPVVARHTAPPPSGLKLRHRGDLTPGRPLGPGPIPGPVAGVEGRLDLTIVGPAGLDEGPVLLPPEPSRRRGWWVVIRLLASAGIIGIGTGLGAILGAAGLATWLVALVVSFVCVGLAALLWSLRLARR